MSDGGEFPQFYAVGPVDIIQTVTVAEIYTFGQVKYVVPYRVDATGGVLDEIAVGVVFMSYFHLQARTDERALEYGRFGGIDDLAGFWLWFALPISHAKRTANTEYYFSVFAVRLGKISRVYSTHSTSLK